MGTASTKLGPGRVGANAGKSRGTGHGPMFGHPKHAVHFGEFPDGGGYPLGFMEWALGEMGNVAGIEPDPRDVLHLCSGSVKTGVRVDIRPEVKPDIVADCRHVPLPDESFDWIMADPPYSAEYAKNLYGTEDAYPKPGQILIEATRLLRPRRARWPTPPPSAGFQEAAPLGGCVRRASRLRFQPSRLDSATKERDRQVSDWPHEIPKREWLKAKRYIRRLMLALGIQWNVHLQYAYGGDNNASITCFPNVREALLWLGDHWPEMDAEDRRYALTHEMVHLMSSGENQLVEESFIPCMPKGARKLAASTYRNVEEQRVDALAWQLSKYMPEYPA